MIYDAVLPAAFVFTTIFGAVVYGVVQRIIRGRK
jgi:hypothetical protein